MLGTQWAAGRWGGAIEARKPWLPEYCMFYQKVYYRGSGLHQGLFETICQCLETFLILKIGWARREEGCLWHLWVGVGVPPNTLQCPGRPHPIGPNVSGAEVEKPCLKNACGSGERCSISRNIFMQMCIVLICKMRVKNPLCSLLSIRSCLCASMGPPHTLASVSMPPTVAEEPVSTGRRPAFSILFPRTQVPACDCRQLN